MVSEFIHITLEVDMKNIQMASLLETVCRLIQICDEHRVGALLAILILMMIIGLFVAATLRFAIVPCRRRS